MIKSLYILAFFSILHSVGFAETWIQKASFGGSGRHRAVGIAIGNKGYIGTGHVNGSGVDISYKDWWQYDPASNSWTQKADFPVSEHGAVAWGTSDYGYVGGGSALNGEFYKYNPQTNTWSAIASCPLNAGDNQGFSVQGKGYVYVGNQLAEYSPVSNSWQLKANSPISFGNWCSAYGTNSSGYVKYIGNFYEYKPLYDQWIQRASFPGLMSNGSSAFELNDKGYFTCGYVGGLSIVTDQVWEYNPGNNTWTMVEEFPGTSRRFPVAFSINGRGYFGTGTNGINLNDFWEYYYNPLSVDEIGLTANDVSIFPNPSNGPMTIQIKNEKFISYKNLNLEVYSINGQLVKSEKFETTSLSLDRALMQSGIYFYSIKNGESVLNSGKLIFL